MMVCHKTRLQNEPISMSRLFHFFLIHLGILILGCLALSQTGVAEGFGDETIGEFQSRTDVPLEVGVGIQIEQITFVDQQAENFGVVASIVMKMHIPELAFDAEAYGKPYQVHSPEDFIKLAREKLVVLPAFIIANQQGRRFTQQHLVLLEASGDIKYVERFSTTLQAPYFNFRKYPFDSQIFYLEVASLFSESFIKFTPIDDLSGLGDLLGEEEWVLHSPKMVTKTIEGITGEPTSQVALSFQAHRHLQFYLLRLLLPLLMILFVSWATFFLEEYRRRIDMANANLLVFVAFNFAISSTLPRLGYLTFLDSLLAGMFVITGSMVLVNIALRRLKIKDREDLARKIDRYLVIWVYPLMYVGFLLWAARYFLI